MDVTEELVIGKVYHEHMSIFVEEVARLRFEREIAGFWEVFGSESTVVHRFGWGSAF